MAGTVAPCIDLEERFDNQGKVITVDLQWLEHWWLVYNGCFELVLESLGNQIAADLGWFSF